MNQIKYQLDVNEKETERDAKSKKEKKRVSEMI